MITEVPMDVRDQLGNRSRCGRGQLCILAFCNLKRK